MHCRSQAYISQMIAADDWRHITGLVHRLFKMTAKELKSITKHTHRLVKITAVQFHHKNHLLHLHYQQQRTVYSLGLSRLPYFLSRVAFSEGSIYDTGRKSRRIWMVHCFLQTDFREDPPHHYNLFIFAIESFCTNSNVWTLLLGKALWPSLTSPHFFSLPTLPPVVEMIFFPGQGDDGSFVALWLKVSFVRSFANISGYGISESLEDTCP